MIKQRLVFLMKTDKISYYAYQDDLVWVKHTKDGKQRTFRAAMEYIINTRQII